MAQKILVVEDEFLSRDSIVKFLSMAGYIVREASNGAEALEKLTAERFDIVVTDFVMPHIDGLRLIELVHSKWPELPSDSSDRLFIRQHRTRYSGRTSG